MRILRAAVVASLTLLASLGLSSGARAGQQFHGSAAFHGMSWVSFHNILHPIVPHGFFTLPSVPHAPHTFTPSGVVVHPSPNRFHQHRRFFGPAVIGGSSVVVYAPGVPYVPASYYDSAAYAPGAGYDVPAVYIPPAPAAAPPVGTTVSVAPLTVPSVVEFSTGRYELRGDGLTVAYTWVWIPNPPSAPPTAGGSQGAPSTARWPVESPRASERQVYRWTDKDGVLHVTDRLQSVPAEYRTQVKPQPS
jgi:hypothetical protein